MTNDVEGGEQGDIEVGGAYKKKKKNHIFLIGLTKNDSYMNFKEKYYIVDLLFQFEFSILEHIGGSWISLWKAQ